LVEHGENPQLSVVDPNDISGQRQSDPVAFIVLGIGSPEVRVKNVFLLSGRYANSTVFHNHQDLAIDHPEGNIYGPAVGGLTGIQNYVGYGQIDRKSTRLNSSHVKISYAV